MLHGGVCHRTSNPHKSGNKMKMKKMKASVMEYIVHIVSMFCLKLKITIKACVIGRSHSLPSG